MLGHCASPGELNSVEALILSGIEYEIPIVNVYDVISTCFLQQNISDNMTVIANQSLFFFV